MVTRLKIPLSQLLQTLVRNRACCVSCGTLFTTGDFRTPITNHQAIGNRHITTSDITAPMWVYAKCPKCEYQSALWKIAKGMNT